VSLKFGLIKGWASVTWTWKQQPPSVWPHGRLVNRSIFMRWWNGPLVVLKAKWDVICAHYLASRVNAIICKRERCSTRKKQKQQKRCLPPKPYFSQGRIEYIRDSCKSLFLVGEYSDHKLDPDKCC
jgi:hypothetical protein